MKFLSLNLLFASMLLASNGVYGPNRESAYIFSAKGLNVTICAKEITIKDTENFTYPSNIETEINGLKKENEVLRNQLTDRINQLTEATTSMNNQHQGILDLKQNILDLNQKIKEQENKINHILTSGPMIPPYMP